MIGVPDEVIKGMYLIKTHYIMRVIEFHPEDQTVDLIQDTYEFCNTISGDITVKNEMGYEVTVGVQKPTILKRIPVKQERWGQFEIQCCPQPGDTGYIEVFTNDITDWIRNGGLNVPKSDRHFIKDSSVFVPFVPNGKNKSDEYPIDGTKLIIRSNTAKIEMTDDGETVDISTTANTINVNADNGISIKGDITSEGDISVKGNITVEGTITASGDIMSTEGDVVAGTVSLKTHTHVAGALASPVGPVEGTTGVPVA